MYELMHSALSFELWFWSEQLRNYREGFFSSNFKILLCGGHFLIEKRLDYFTTASRLFMFGSK